MTPKEAFKIGFLQKCAADGLSQEETMQRIVHAKFMLKTGDGMTLSALKGAGGMTLDTLKAIWGATWPLALLAPPLIGLGGGAVLAKAQDDTYDIDEARTREEISEYGRAIERLQRLHARQAAMGAV